MVADHLISKAALAIHRHCFPPTTPLAAQVSTVQQKMATFKVYDPATGQYVEKEIEGMAQEAAQPVVQAVQQAAQPVVQTVQQAAQPVVQAVQPVVQAVQPVVQAAQPVVQAVQQAVPTIQVQPQLQQMPVMVKDPVTGQLV